MHEPWETGCLGCEQEARIKETNYKLKKQEAEEYAKKNKIDLVIYMEGQVWKFYSAADAASIGIFHYREIIRFSEHTINGQVH